MRLRFDDIVNENLILPSKLQGFGFAFAGDIGLAFQRRDESDGVGRRRTRRRGRDAKSETDDEQDAREENGCRHSAFQKLPLNVTEYTMRS
jgi:hypothetical protein